MSKMTEFGTLCGFAGERVMMLMMAAATITTASLQARHYE
jgi:hypothetical protein